MKLALGRMLRRACTLAGWRGKDPLLPACRYKMNAATSPWFSRAKSFPTPTLFRRSGNAATRIQDDPASYLVHRYEEESDFPKGLNGRFHGLIVDRSRGTSLLFNDRFGLQRLYYHQAQDAFYFAAEAKAILKVRPELRSVDPRGLGEFIVCGCVLENRTLFPGIHLLPPGSAWTFRGATLEKKATYFEPREWEEQKLLTAEEYSTRSA